MGDPQKRLKELREKLGLTQKELGEKLGMSWYQIKDIETGATKKLTPTIAKLLYYEVGVNPEWLLTGEGDMLINNKNKSPQIEDLNLVPEIQDLIKDLKQATNKAINLNKLIYSPPAQSALTVREEKTTYTAPSIPPWMDDQAADDYDSKDYPVIDGSIACGIPSAIAEDHIIDRIPLPKKFNIKADFVMKTKGDSMTEYGITSGMLVFIRKQTTIEHGNIVLLAVYESGEVQPVLKKVKLLSGGTVVFQNCKGEIMEQNENVEVIGVATFWMPDIRGGGGEDGTLAVDAGNGSAASKREK
ncbi:MAG: S24 family peptidase [Candidatus Eremiobacterota bacterium]